MAGASDPSPIAYYYCEVGVRERLALSRTSRPEERTEGSFLLQARFEPSVLRRLPLEERAGVRFAPEVAMFCFPHGVRLVNASVAAANAIPKVTSFVLTASDKSRMYGACIVWYERLPDGVVQACVDEVMPECDGLERAAERALAGELHAPEAICLLSSAPIFEALNSCCRQLFRMRLSGGDPASTEYMLTEASLRPLLTTPLPDYGGRVDIPLGNVTVHVAIPPANELPHTMAGRDFLLLFECLDVSSVIVLWALLLAEQKVLLQARQTHVLTMAAESLCALLFPFSWQHVYIPILPASLLDILQAPVPFLIGIDEEVLGMAEQGGLVPDDVVQVDLDASSIVCDPEVARAIRLPQKQYHKLYKALAPFCRASGRQSEDAEGGAEGVAAAGGTPARLAASARELQTSPDGPEYL
mmetsp:Transcript_617/g.1933  ORF Transcript_617/g.1933 Transcript_617/m.1933 type:complete len:415 (-) Transcript_617:515-1759(-)